MAGAHELGRVMKLPPEVVPFSVRAIELIVIPTGPSKVWSAFGMLEIEVSSPKSPGRTLTETGSFTLLATTPPISGGCTQMPSRAGSPALGATS